MSDVEKAISGLVEDEDLLQLQQQKQQQQIPLTPLNKTNISNYNLQSKTGNTTLLQKQNHHLHHNNSLPTATAHHQLLSQDSTHSNATNIAHTSSNYLTTQQYTCLSRLAKLIFSTPGLVIMVVVYTIMGAFIFPLLEAPQDISKSALIAKSREECLKELWIITEKLNVLYERNWTMLVHEQLRRFEGTIVAATRNMAAANVGSATSGTTVGGYAGMSTDTTSTTTTALGRYGNNNLAEYGDLTTTRWSFSESLLYSVTVITTIGHGSLTPRTPGGKIATIFYALIGVPLMLMCLSSLGALLAEALQCTYARLCCRWPQYTVNGGKDLNDEMLSSKHKQSHTKKHQQKPSTNSRDMLILEKEEPHHEIKKNLQQCDFQEHQNSINCKNCKYDAIIGETNTNVGYDYKLCNDATTTATSLSAAAATAASSSQSLLSGATAAGAAITTSAMTTMKLGHKEDCCQLLQNSPGKFTQHLSSCMQLKMSPTKAVGGSSETSATTMQAGQASTAKQYYQQRPDVMLMTTGHKLSAQQPVSTMAASCHMALPTTSDSQVTQPRFYHTNTPTMATYHIVSSASANSSPTHQQSIRHYIVPPPTSTSSTVTQHFMAVPTNMLRFHNATSLHQLHQQQLHYGNINNTKSNVNINPLALPVSGSATVYFPIVTPATIATQSTSLAAVPGISQPLIKYHTLQMPHKRQQNVMMLQQTTVQDNQIRNNIEDIADAHATVEFLPPPPPAYQTAAVHGIRRAKFLTKPLPQEINTLLQESDISCRHDLSPHLQTYSSASLVATEGCGSEQQHMSHTTVMPITTSTTGQTPTSTNLNCYTRNANETETSITTTAVTTNCSSFCGGNSNKINHFASPSALSSTTMTTSSPTLTALTNNLKTNTSNGTDTSTTSTSAIIYENQESLTKEDQLLQDSIRAASELSGRHTIAVDIMEDEEEHEQQRLGNCPHGTPSRVPLLNSSSSTTDDKSHTRSFLNATAASFHRHTLNTFQRTNIPQRKSIIINHKGECNVHIPKRRNSTSANTTVCYTDPYDDMLTSDDDCGILESKNVYKLQHLHHQQTNVQTDNKHLVQEDYYDNNSLVSLAESTAQIPQVPIIVVLFILIFYISLGTVIFALWENWSLIDGAYFCFVTLTTIGYGDFMPLKTFQGPEIQLFACCAYLLLGLVLVAMSFSILETQLIWKCKRLAVRLKLAKE